MTTDRTSLKSGPGKSVQASFFRMSPRQFREAVLAKGWTYADLAFRWGVTPGWVSTIAADPMRDFRYDDAVRGLPRLTRLELRHIQESRHRIERAKKGPVRTKAAGDSSPIDSPYSTDFVVGAIIISDDLGEGVVLAVKQEGRVEKYLIDFGGAADWYGPSDIDRGLYATGRMKVARHD